MPIDLYSHPLSPPSRACLITGKLLNVPLNVKDVDVLAGAHLTAEYLAINPNHAVPALVDGNFKLTESRAIITYLANKYAPDSSLYPKDAQARAQVDKVLFFDASTFYPSLMAVYVSLCSQYYYLLIIYFTFPLVSNLSFEAGCTASCHRYANRESAHPRVYSRWWGVLCRQPDHPSWHLTCGLNSNVSSFLSHTSFGQVVRLVRSSREGGSNCQRITSRNDETPTFGGI